MSSSPATQANEALAALGLVSVILLGISLNLNRRQRLIKDLPNSKVQGVFIGLVELKVSAESEKPLTSYLAGEACVHYSYKVEEHWSRQVTETYTDDKGQIQTRGKTEEGWQLVASGGASAPFYGKDETGVILVRPEGAKFECVHFYDHTVQSLDPLYHGKGPAAPIPNSTGRRRFTEEWLPLHSELFIVGQARERDDVVAPEIAASKSAELFLISGKSQSLVQAKYEIYALLAWACGLLMAIAAGHFGHDVLHAQPRTHVGAISLGALYLAAGIIGWSWTVFNSLIKLRSRVRQGWSLIEIELKRRNDLIPSLATAVSALSAHEAGVQTAVAALRNQLLATRPGEPGPDVNGVAGTVRMIAEKYPSLVAQEGFAKLQEQLVVTEQRIALARTYYNDIATRLTTRVGQFPDALLASVGGIKAEPLLVAEGFERAAVKVSLAKAG